MANTVTLSADKTEINVGDTVSFTFTGPSLTTNYGGLYDNNWKLFISNVTIPSTRSYTFNTIGTYRLRYVNSISDDSSEYVTITVSDAPTHDYAIEFDESSYNTCNGSCTITATLTDNNNPVSGETVTLTGTGSSITATTDNNGIATFNLSNISENKILTVTFDEVSDTATLTYNLATLNGSLTCLGKKLASNLTSKGVTGVDYTDGLTSLADEILNITTLDDYEEVELLITYTDTSTETITVLKEKTTS